MQIRCDLDALSPASTVSTLVLCRATSNTRRRCSHQSRACKLLLRPYWALLLPPDAMWRTGEIKVTRRNATALDKGFFYGYIAISGEELAVLLPVYAVCKVATDTHTHIYRSLFVGIGKVSSVFSRYCPKKVFAKFWGRADIHDCKSLS